MKNTIKFIVNPSEITAGTRGASLGPAAIQTAARKRGSFLFSEFPIVQINDRNDLLDRQTLYPKAKNIDGLVTVFEEISAAISTSVKENRFPLILAADHGSAGGTIAGLKKVYPNKRLGVIWIDAHGDLHSPYTTPSGNMHGMPLSTALNEDNLPCRQNEIDETTTRLWNQLKNMHDIAPKILPEDLIFIAVRDTETEENALINRLNIRNFAVDEVRAKGARQIAAESLELLQQCDVIYISFDVDSMDPELTSHGTGTPVPNGLQPLEAQEMLTDLLQSEKVVCFEIVEVNPCLDEKINKMAETTFEILEACVASITQK